MAESTPIQVSITKGGAPILVNTGDLPDNVYQAALAIGLKDLLNRGMSKIKSNKDLEGEDKAKNQAAAMAQAEKNLANLKEGKMPRMVGVKTADGKVAGVVMTEARRLAKNLIKDEIKKAGGKISHYEAKDITAAANALLETEEGKALLAQAQKNVDDRNKIVEEKPATDLATLQEKLKINVSAAKVAKAEKEKAAKKGKGEAILSAAKAGQIKTRTAQPATH